MTNTPVLMPTAQEAIPDRIPGLDGRADDFFSKLSPEIREVVLVVHHLVDCYPSAHAYRNLSGEF